MSRSNNPETLRSERLWEALDRVERPWLIGTGQGAGIPIFADPEELWKVAVMYFNWTKENPVESAKHSTYEGASRLDYVPRMRAPSKNGLCAYIGINNKTIDLWADENHKDYRPDLAPMIRTIKAVIYDEKFAAAAAGELNPLMIARDLGLMDGMHLKQDMTVKPKGSEVKFAISDASAMLYHPDDVHCRGPLYTSEQLDAGVPYVQRTMAAEAEAGG